MHFFVYLKKHMRFVVMSVIVVLILIGLGIRHEQQNNIPLTTSEVSKGTVRSIVSISGNIDAVSTAELGFPISGTLKSIDVTEGAVVTVGQTLAALVADDIQAEYRDAQATLLIAQADRDELISGIRPEERDITSTKTEIARKDLERITLEQNERVRNAEKALLSNDLEALTARNDSSVPTPPTISGTYTCARGTYIINMFRSNARSGYSYRLSGLESGTYSASTDAPAPFGNCGLSIQFAPNESYTNTEWKIEIPNTQSPTYVTYANAYSLAQTERTNNITEATQALKLAEQEENLSVADPRNEARARAEARVIQAQARVSGIEAQMRDHVLTAPFPGTVTKILPTVGESVTTAPIITMTSDSAFELNALVPEIDITKISVGQKAEVVFDARQQEILPAVVSFISPLAREIDGVSYFEATLNLTAPAPWLRSGLNADIDILIEERTDVSRIPKRYLIEENGTFSVRVPEGEDIVSKQVTPVFTGNDGFVEITGLDVGTTIVAP